MRGECVCRREVDVAPGGMIRAHFEHHEIEGPEAFAYLGVLCGRACAAAEKHAVARR